MFLFLLFFRFFFSFCGWSSFVGDAGGWISLLFSPLDGPFSLFWAVSLALGNTGFPLEESTTWRAISLFLFFCAFFFPSSMCYTVSLVLSFIWIICSSALFIGCWVGRCIYMRMKHNIIGHRRILTRPPTFLRVMSSSRPACVQNGMGQTAVTTLVAAIPIGLNIHPQLAHS